jgi:hypothetical protein
VTLCPKQYIYIYTRLLIFFLKYIYIQYISFSKLIHIYIYLKIYENIIICYVVLNAILNGVISYFILLHHMVLYQTRLYYIVLHRILNIEYYKKHIFCINSIYIYYIYIYSLLIRYIF